MKKYILFIIILGLLFSFTACSQSGAVSEDTQALSFTLQEIADISAENQAEAEQLLSNQTMYVSGFILDIAKDYAVLCAEGEKGIAYLNVYMPLNELADLVPDSYITIIGVMDSEFEIQNSDNKTISYFSLSDAHFVSDTIEMSGTFLGLNGVYSPAYDFSADNIKFLVYFAEAQTPSKYKNGEEMSIKGNLFYDSNMLQIQNAEIIE